MDMLLVTLPTTNPATTQRVLDAFADLKHVEAKSVREITDLYSQGHGLIGICASGILIRAVAHLLVSKKSDPPLLALADDASVAVPLLGGHHGANDWARKLEDALGCFAALTTASDVSLKFNFEQPPTSLALVSNPQAYKAAVARMLKGAGIELVIDCALSKSAKDYFAALPKVESQSGTNPVLVYVGHTPPENAQLVYRPIACVLGVGASRGCPTEELQALALSCLKKAGLDGSSVIGVCSHQLKHDEAAVLALAKFFNVEPQFYDSPTLNKHKASLSETSEIVFRETGSWGVAEAAALESFGQAGQLILTKQKTAMATCAIAINNT